MVLWPEQEALDSQITAARYLTAAEEAAIVAYVGDSLSHLIGVTNAISVLGGIVFVGLLVWLWKESRDRRARARVPNAA